MMSAEPISTVLLSLAVGCVVSVGCIYLLRKLFG